MPNLLHMPLLAEGFNADLLAQQAAGALDLVGLAVVGRDQELLRIAVFLEIGLQFSDVFWSSSQRSAGIAVRQAELSERLLIGRALDSEAIPRATRACQPQEKQHAK